MAKCVVELVEPVGVLGEPRAVDEVLLDEHREERTEAPGVGARAHLKVEVGELGRLAAARVDDDERPIGIVRDRLQDRASAREAVGLPRVLADEHRHLGVLVVARRVAPRPTEELAVDPELTGLLLRECVRAVRDAERAAGRAAVTAAEVVPLPTAAVIEDRRAAVGVADGAEPRRHLADRGVPVDLLERAVVATPERRRQSMPSVLVVVETQRLLARVALRRGMSLVTADALDAPPIESHFDAAVDAAEDARGLMPLSFRVAGHDASRSGEFCW